ncbi:MAG: DUF3391 domain-containing protein, partial [Pseudomonadota bacterium]
MLKVVSTEQVRLGMFIQELKGAWIDHPFWKKAFKLDDVADLIKLQASIVKEVVIDVSKGLDIEDLNDERSTNSNNEEIRNIESSVDSDKVENDNNKAVNTIVNKNVIP